MRFDRPALFYPLALSLEERFRPNQIKPKQPKAPSLARSHTRGERGFIHVTNTYCNYVFTRVSCTTHRFDDRFERSTRAVRRFTTRRSISHFQCRPAVAIARRDRLADATETPMTIVMIAGATVARVRR
jgi:hypothetical protein